MNARRTFDAWSSALAVALVATVLTFY